MKASRGTSQTLGLLALFFLAMAIAAPAPADASRLLVAAKAFSTTEELECGSFCPPPFPQPDGQIEGACGVAVKAGEIYVSDYYHRAVDVFGPAPRTLLSQPPPPSPFEAEAEGPCGLVFHGSELFANYWHQRVVRSTPPYSYDTVETIDAGESTGVAIDASGDVYVNDRTYVAVYEAPVVGGEPPARIIGLGSLGDAYGVAVAAGRVYVPDAADNTVKVYEPAANLVEPAFVIDGSGIPAGGFHSLVDAAVAVDSTNGHLVVLDNLQPGFEHPEAQIQEFDSSGGYLGRACGTVVDGGPSGLAFSGGNLYVTTGNGERSNVSLFGPFTSSPCPQSAGVALGAAATAQAQSVPAGDVAVAPASVTGNHRQLRHRHRHHPGKAKTRHHRPIRSNGRGR
jgi:DNA-binding beta-propeller fold protein YncE